MRNRLKLVTMKTIDLYTKVVLTIIAVSLSVFAFNNIRFVPEAKAQTSAFSGVVKVDIVSVNGKKLYTNSRGALYVDINDQVTDQIFDWGRDTYSDERNHYLQVKVVNTNDFK